MRSSYIFSSSSFVDRYCILFKTYQENDFWKKMKYKMENGEKNFFNLKMSLEGLLC